jgi:hypothetical protein
MAVNSRAPGAAGLCVRIGRGEVDEYTHARRDPGLDAGQAVLDHHALRRRMSYRSFLRYTLIPDRQGNVGIRVLPRPSAGAQRGPWKCNTGICRTSMGQKHA